MWRSVTTDRAASRIVLEDARSTRRSLRMSFGSNGRTTVAVGRDDLADDLRLVELAAVRERRVGVDELDRRHDVVALADARLVDLAREDRLAEGLELPLVRRDDPGDLARQVDAGRRAEAVLAGPSSASRSIAELARELEEERVARVAEAAVDVAGARSRGGSSPRTWSSRASGTAASGSACVGVIFLSARAPVPATSLYVEPGG